MRMKIKNPNKKQIVAILNFKWMNMCNFFLVRHGESEAMDYIAGRAKGVHLTKKGMSRLNN